MSLQLDDKQKAAVALATDKNNKIVTITGPAGSGKTTILREVYDYFHRQNIKTVAIAPTGKAARRIKEATGIDAMTVHRLLEFPHPGEIDPKSGKPLSPTIPRRDASNRIDYQAVIADEYAMVSHDLDYYLKHAIPGGGWLRVFGDANQLRPVEENKAHEGKPSPFENMLASAKYNPITLETIHRQDEGSIIRLNANAIRLGISLKHDPEHFPISFTSEPVKAVIELAKQNPILWAGPSAQFISPTKNSWIGTQSLNLALQAVVFADIQDRRKSVQLERHKWDRKPLTLYVGDKVLVTANNYHLNVFNGEIGVVVDIDEHNDAIQVDFGDRIITFPAFMEVARGGDKGTIIIYPHRDLALAYVITTHKSQGSEWDEVAYIINRSCYYQCNRRNAYTAITRARKRVHLFTDSTSMSATLWNKGDR